MFYWNNLFSYFRRKAYVRACCRKRAPKLLLHVVVDSFDLLSVSISVLHLASNGGFLSQKIRIFPRRYSNSRHSLTKKKHIQDSRHPLWIIKSPTSPSPPAPIHPLPLRQHILLKMFARKQPLVSILRQAYNLWTFFHTTFFFIFYFSFLRTILSILNLLPYKSKFPNVLK